MTEETLKKAKGLKQQMDALYKRSSDVSNIGMHRERYLTGKAYYFGFEGSGYLLRIEEEDLIEDILRLIKVYSCKKAEILKQEFEDL